MNERWTGQTVAAVLGMHLLTAVLVAAALIYLVAHWRRVRIRWAQVAAVRGAIAGWLTQTPVSPPPGDGSTETGAGTPDSAPVSVPHRVRIEMGGHGRHWAA